MSTAQDLFQYFTHQRNKRNLLGPKETGRTIAHLINSKVKQYILNNFFTIKQVTNLYKIFTDICTESPVEEMRLAAQMLDFTFFQDIEEEKFETIPLPAQITAHRRKMIDQPTSAYKISFEHDIRTYIESLK
uniref:Phage_int_SAM_5 domain-containing protein n=1 Tax=Parastrongyloides trichosuri TaxID=131310 RepID=A0A0N4ZAF3_PARTI